MLTHVLRMLCDIVWLATHIQGVVQFQGAKVGRPHRVAAAAAFHPVSSHSWPKKNLRNGCRAGGHTLTAAPHILRAKEDNRGSWAHESRPSFFVLGTLSIVHIRLVHRAFAKKIKKQCSFLIKKWDPGTLVLHLPLRIRILADKKCAIKYGYHVSSI